MSLFLFYHGPITIPGVRNAETLCLAAVDRGVKDLKFCICSGGGDVTAGIGLYNFLRMLPLNVHTHCFGVCGSIAATVFLAGSRRTTTAASSFSLHAASYVEGPRAGEVSENTQIILLPFKTTLHWPQERLDHYFGSALEKFIRPEEARGFGMIDDIDELKMSADDERITVNIP